jgi:hypothetical protein
MGRMTMGKAKTGRNAGAQARAKGRASQGSGIDERGGKGQGLTPLAAVNSSGKSLAQLQGERIAEERFTAMMSSAGVPVHRMALEILYMLPRDFIDAYAELFTRALAGDDGGAGGRGEAARQTADLGRAARKTSGGQGKKYKKYWTVRNDAALELKDKIDKRLRAIGRELRMRMDEADVFGRQLEKADRGLGSVTEDLARVMNGHQCGNCGRFLSRGWKFCANCGARIATGDLT